MNVNAWPKDLRVYLGYALGVAGLLLCIVVALAISSEQYRPTAINLMLCVFGFTFGWVVGILITPAKAEEESFKRIGGAILTFVSGFVVAKIEPILANSMQQRGASPLFDEMFLGRILLFTTTFLLGALFVFVGRRYWAGLPTVPEQTAQVARPQPPPSDEQSL